MFGLKRGDRRGTGAIDKRVAVTATGVALLSLLFLWGGVTFSSKYTAVKRLYGVKLKEAGTFKELRDEYLTKKGRLDFLRRKAFGVESRSVVALVEKIAAEAGVRKRITSLKSLGESVESGYVKSGVELQIERVELNELVNFLYIIEFNRLLFVVSDFRLKGRFDNPDLIDVSMKLALMKKSG